MTQIHSGILANQQYSQLLDVNSNEFFQDEFLKPKGTSKDFLQAVQYQIPLKDLYLYKRSCSYHVLMNFQPVIFEIVDFQLQQYYNGKYLLLIYDQNGEKVYEKSLKYDLVCWNIFHDYFTFKLDPKEEEGQFIYVLNIPKKFAVIKIKDFTIDDPSYTMMGINQELFFIANANNIKIVNIKVALNDGEVKTIDFKEEEIVSYPINAPNKLLGLFENGFSKADTYILCSIEVDDNQIDTTRLYIWDRDNIVSGGMGFYQYREIVPRIFSGDPIVKFKQVIKKTEFQFGVALRSSGKVDLYWNFTLINQITSGNASLIQQQYLEVFVDVNINFESIILIKEAKDAQQQHIKKEIKLSWGSRIGLEVGEDLVLDDYHQYQVEYGTIAKSVKLFTSLTLFTTDFFIAHGKIISVYAVIEKKWIKHIYVSDEIFALCRNESTFQEYKLGVVCKNGLIYTVSTVSEAPELEEGSKKMEGTVVSLIFDWTNQNTNYILVDNPKAGKKELYGYSTYSFENITQQVDDIKENCDFVRLYTEDLTSYFVHFDRGTGEVSIYENQSKSGYFSLSLKEEITLSSDDLAKFSLKIHTAVRAKSEDHILVVDNLHSYKINMKTKAVEKIEKQKIRQLFLLDAHNMYQMRDCNKTKHSGFFYQDIGEKLEKVQNVLYPLDDCISGVNSLVDYNEDGFRISYLTSYEEVKIVPNLNRNVISFFGMDIKKNYVCTRKHYDKFIALDTKGYLITWSICTGKLLSKYKVKSTLDFSDYRVYQQDSTDDCYFREWCAPNVLIKSTSEVPNYSDTDHCDPAMMKSSLNNNEIYMTILQKTYHYFKVITILNDREIKEQFTFINPVISSEPYQRMYFSDNLNYMLQRLQNQRVFIYKREDHEDGISKWILIRRMKQFPMDISEVCYANYLFSPDLMYYLDFDKSKNIFQIKDTITQQPHKDMPQGLMTPKSKDDVLNIVKRFQWINSGQIRVINHEGIEKIVDINNNFKELEYGTVPMIQIEMTKYFGEDVDDTDTEIKKYHYFFNQTPLAYASTEERLIRKQRAYKQGYFLDKVRSRTDMYNNLFTVDYNTRILGDDQLKHQAELPFTYVHWLMIEIMAVNKEYDSIEVTYEEAKLLTLNILPNCNTILHKCFHNLQLMRSLYEVVAESKSNFVIPFIKNMDGESPLHLAFNVRNLKAVEIFLDKIKNEPLDSHGRAVIEVLPQCVDYQIKTLGEYMECRFLKTEQCKELKRGCLNFKQDLDYVVVSSDIWYNPSDVESMLFTVSPLDSEINLRFLDIPQLHCYQEKVGDEFFKSLGDTKDIEFFKYKSVQAIIDYKWPLAREYTFKILFIQFLIFMGVFIAQQNAFYFSDLSLGTADYVLCAILLFFCLYYLVNEVKQLFNNGIDYFLSFWNYVDLLSPMMLVIITIIHLTGNDEKLSAQATLRCIATLLMWLKFLYFLRIFRMTGYLVRILTDVFYDMRIFLLILMFAYLGFGEAFKRLSEQSADDAQFIDNNNYAGAIVYVLRLSLGDFNTDQYNDSIQPVTAWILFFICCLVTSVIMLNMLVAIISESFDDTNSRKIFAQYQEKARIIAENSYLIPKASKVKFCDKRKYLIIAKESIANEEVIDEDLVTQINGIKEALNELKANNYETLKHVQGPMAQ